MIEQMASQLYKIEIPLPKNPLKATNSYVIKTPERHLVIDTGMNRKECMKAMDDALERLDIDLERTDFFITHLHADHLGLVDYLSTANSRVYFNRPDAAVVENFNFWEQIYSRALTFGFPESELEKAIKEHPGNRFSHGGKIPFHFVGDGDVITAGEFRLECVETPGHTRGHTCLYERRKKLLFSGDHILGDITPNISSWSGEENLLEQYLDSLGRIYRMEVERVFPGHRSVIFDCRGRIQELLYHHQQRVEEIGSILKNGEKTAFEVASEMSWDIVSESWDALPVTQKWFATGEAIAHLVYMENKGLLSKELNNGKTVFWKSRK